MVVWPGVVPIQRNVYIEDTAQLEDGVGVTYDILLEVDYSGLVLPHSADVVTGTPAVLSFQDCADALMLRNIRRQSQVLERYFGGNVQREGLITGATSSNIWQWLNSDLLCVRDEEGAVPR